ncbi:MAG: glycosyltransferase 87 family protein [Solirubrobacterales bacterium]
MTDRGRRLLWLIIAAGTVGRTVLAFATVGQEFDIESLRLVAAQLDESPLELYRIVNAGSDAGSIEILRWPYPPGYLPWAAAALALADATGLPFHGVVQLAPIAADAAIAWLVQDYLGARGASERTRLGAVALVALGPAFWLISGYHGQLDPVAILPAVAAVWAWERTPPARRGLVAGALIGLGGAVKTVPLLVTLALLPSARSFREAATLIGAAAAVPLLALAPFLIADFDGASRALGGYSGAPGLGGITMLLQPGLSRAVLTGDFPIEIDPLVQALYDNAAVIILLTLAAAAAVLARYRPAPAEGAALIWLGIYVTSPTFFAQYAVWGLPFMLMCAQLGRVALIQAVLLAPTLLLYALPWEAGVATSAYVVAMAALWLLWVAALVAQARAIRGTNLGPSR